MILQDGSTPVKYGLAMDMEEKGSAIPPRLAKLTGVPPQNIVLVDIVQSQVQFKLQQEIDIIYSKNH